MLWVCADCTTRYAVGISACPHCGSTDREDNDMPKITRHGGASNTAPDGDLPHGATVTKGGEDTSPGSSSETSSAKSETSQKTNARDRQKRARTTGSRSSKGQTEGSTAARTGGDGPKTPSTDETTD